MPPQPKPHLSPEEYLALEVLQHIKASTFGGKSSLWPRESDPCPHSHEHCGSVARAVAPAPMHRVCHGSPSEGQCLRPLHLP